MIEDPRSRADPTTAPPPETLTHLALATANAQALAGSGLVCA
jgi:hypothetical protein